MTQLGDLGRKLETAVLDAGEESEQRQESAGMALDARDSRQKKFSATLNHAKWVSLSEIEWFSNLACNLHITSRIFHR